MKSVIKNLCNALTQEVESVKSYTDMIEATPNDTETEGTLRMFGVGRMDAVEHIQNIVVELAKIIADAPLGDKTSEDK